VTLLARRFEFAALLFSGPSYEGLPFNLSTIFGSCSSLKRGKVFRSSNRARGVTHHKGVSTPFGYWLAIYSAR